ncbi:MAG TPA: WG repeat-containing protein [Abditibacterium sp.]
MLLRILLFALCFFNLCVPCNAAERLFAIRDGKKWGFINRTGRIVIAPRFDEVGSRSEGLWSIKSGKKWGFVAESSGQVAIAPRFEAVGVWSEGLCGVIAGGKVGFIGKNGKFQIAPRFVATLDNISVGFVESHFSGDLAPAQISENEAQKRGYKGTYGFINRMGNWKITPRFSVAEPMSDGMARVTIIEADFIYSGYVSQIGKFVPLPKGASDMFNETFYEGLAAVPVLRDAKTGRRLYGFIDKTGKWAIPPRFLEVLYGGDILEMRTGFKDGLATVMLGDKPQNVRVGWIGRDGKWAISPRFNGGGAGFTEGLAPAREGEKPGEGKGGFIDKSGKFVIAPQFEKMGIFSDGLAPTQRKGEEWGYIDATGAQIIAPRFSYVSMNDAITPDMAALQFRDGLAWVQEGNVRGYIGKNGDWVWKESPRL